MEDKLPSTPRSNRRAGLIGGIVGSVGLAAALLTLTATAGAQDTPSLEVPSAEADATIDDADFPGEEEWAAYDECVNAVFEEHGFDIEAGITEAEAMPFDDDGEFAEGVLDFGPEVSVFDGDELTIADFGDGDGTITITKNGDDVSVSSDGDVDVEVVDWDDMIELDELEGEFEAFEGEFDAEFDDAEFDAIDEDLAGCDDQLPEGIEFDDMIELDELDADELAELEDLLDDGEEALPADVN